MKKWFLILGVITLFVMTLLYYQAQAISLPIVVKTLEKNREYPKYQLGVTEYGVYVLDSYTGEIRVYKIDNYDRAYSRISLTQVISMEGI